MNIKTINQLEETNVVSGMYGICSDEEGNTKKYYLNDSPFEKGEAENSAVLKGGDNVVGLKGYYYKSIYKKDSTTIYVYLDKKQKQLPLNETESIENDSIADTTLPNLSEELGIDTVVSLVNHNYYENTFKIIGGSNGVVYLQTVNNVEIPFNEIIGTDDTDKDEYSLYSIEKYNIGLVELAECLMSVGKYNKSTNSGAIACGIGTHAYGRGSFTEGINNIAGFGSHAEGRSTKAIGETSHAEGFVSIASGIRSHAEGYNVESIGENSHAEGNSTVASGFTSHAEGYKTAAQGKYSHAEGYKTAAQGTYSHAEGYSTTASTNSHAEGYSNEASGKYSHAENSNNKATGVGSHVEGVDCISNGRGGHAEGISTITNNNGEHACGQWNKSTKSSKSKGTQYSVGIGTAETDRKNAHEITNDGKHYIIGIGGYDGTNTDAATDIATYIKSLENRIQQLENK